MLIRKSIAVSVLALCAVAGYTLPSMASEQKQVTRTVTVYDMKDAPALDAAVTAVCGDKAVTLSPKARAACDAKAFPAVTKALAFRNTGVGAEFNTLVRQREVAAK